MSTKQRLIALGFFPEDTGGGCTWLRRPCDPLGKLSLCITDGEAHLPMPGHPATLFLFCDQHSEQLMERAFPSLEELTRFLEQSLTP